MNSAEAPPGTPTHQTTQKTACRTFEQRSLAFEPHYKIRQLAKLWAYSDTRVRRIFQDEPGVLKVGEPSRRLGRKLKRSYYTLSIPESVAIRVHNRLSK